MKEVKLFENETYKALLECESVETFNREYVEITIYYFNGVEWVEVENAKSVSPKYQKGLIKRLNETYNA